MFSSLTKPKKRKRKAKLIERFKAEQKNVPSVKYTPAQIREFTKNRAYVLRVYDNPKPHDVLTAERNDPRKSEKEIINHWLELSDKELIVCKPQFIGLPVIMEHMGNDQTDGSWRPMLGGYERKTCGVVVGVEQDDKVNTDVILRFFNTIDGWWACNHLETCFQGASIQHTRSIGEIDPSLREISIVLLGKHKNTNRVRIIELENPPPLEQMSVPYKHIPTFDFSKQEEIVRQHPNYDKFLMYGLAKNQTQQTKPIKIVSYSSILSSSYSLYTESENKMSTDSTPVAATSAAVSSAPSSAPAVASLTPSAPSAPSIPSTPLSVPASSTGAGLSTAPVSASIAAAIAPAVAMDTSSDKPAVAAPSSTPVSAVLPPGASPITTTTTTSSNSTNDTPVAMDTSTDRGSGSTAGTKRAREETPAVAGSESVVETSKRANTTTQSDREAGILQQLESVIQAWVPKVKGEEEPYAAEVLEKLTNLKGEYLQAKKENETLKRDSQFYQGQMDYMHSKFMDDLQNVVRFVMANYSDPDQETFNTAKKMDPRTNTVNDMVRHLGQIVGKASSSIDSFNSFTTRHILSGKKMPEPVSGSASSGSATGATASTASTPAVGTPGAAAPASSSASASAGLAAASPLVAQASSSAGTGSGSSVQTTAQIPQTQTQTPAPTLLPLSKMPLPGVTRVVHEASPSVNATTTLVGTASSMGTAGVTIKSPLAADKTQRSGLHNALDKFMQYRETMMSSLQTTRASHTTSAKPAPLPSVIHEPVTTPAISESAAASSASSAPLVGVASVLPTSTPAPFATGATSITPGSGLAQAYQKWTGKSIKTDYSTAMVPSDEVFQRMKTMSKTPESTIASRVHGYNAMMN